MKKPEMGEISKGETGRRDFFKKIWKFLGFVAAAELIFFFFSLLKPSKEINKSKPGSTVRTIGNIDDFTPGTVTSDRVNKIFIVREGDGGFLALSLICPHLGCSVAWNKITKQFDCPCHSSSFSMVGEVINSPAPRPLDYFPVIIEGGKVKVDINQKSRRRHFESSQMSYAI